MTAIFSVMSLFGFCLPPLRLASTVCSVRYVPRHTAGIAGTGQFGKFGMTVIQDGTGHFGKFRTTSSGTAGAGTDVHTGIRHLSKFGTSSMPGGTNKDFHTGTGNLRKFGTSSIPVSQASVWTFVLELVPVSVRNRRRYGTLR